jgi:crotonobetainyl-CoA:carnitine CoA-transferase CaiB-like acyl-CoA transferase
VAAPNDGLFRSMCRAIECPELAEDERFASNRDRVEHREELVETLAQRFAERTADEWVEALAAAGVPAGKIRGALEAFDAAAEAGRPATVSVAHPTIGELPLIASPIRLTEASLKTPEPPPLLGEHNRLIHGGAASE